MEIDPWLDGQWGPTGLEISMISVNASAAPKPETIRLRVLRASVAKASRVGLAVVNSCGINRLAASKSLRSQRNFRPCVRVLSYQRHPNRVSIVLGKRHPEHSRPKVEGGRRNEILQ